MYIVISNYYKLLKIRVKNVDLCNVVLLFKNKMGLGLGTKWQIISDQPTHRSWTGINVTIDKMLLTEKCFSRAAKHIHCAQMVKL